MKKMLLVEDQDLVRISLADELREADFQVDEAIDGNDAFNKLDQFTYDAVVTDINLPGTVNGITILNRIKRDSPETIVLIITAFGSISSAVEAMKMGADDYLTKPFETEELLLILSKSIKLQILEHENLELRKRLSDKYGYNNFIGETDAIKLIKKTIQLIAPTDESILIEGETGTGKEVLATTIHELSHRKSKPLIEISCAALPKELLESELFGHEKGAFTGAHKKKIGRFELVNGGTIFLDEVDDIPHVLQVKLLRVLQEKEFKRIGGSSTIKADFRVVAATKRNIPEMINQGLFREDLYYRLNVIPITIPPIRERKDDIILLINRFLANACETCDNIDVTSDAMAALIAYNWPGNVRQIKNLIRRLVLLGNCQTITSDLLPAEILSSKTKLENIIPGSIDYHEAMRTYETSLLNSALSQARGNKSEAARILKMKPSTLRDRLSKFDIE
jgi:two-component system, NtrC family, response regulator PilR